jgi:hypothetical protein
MRSNPVILVTVLAGLFGGSAVSAAAEFEAALSSGQASMVPAGGSTSSGLSALKSSNTDSNLRGATTEVSALRAGAEGLSRPQASSWSDGVEALAAVTPGALMASPSAERAMMPPGMSGNIDGLAAIRREKPAAQFKATDESLLESATMVGGNAYQPPAK